MRRLVLLLVLSLACAHRAGEPEHPAKGAAPSPSPDAGYTVTLLARPAVAEPAASPAGERTDAGTAKETRAPLDGLELPPPPGDLRLSLYSKRLDFRDGEPLVPIRLMEGQREVVFSARGRLRMHLPSKVEKTVDAPPGSRWRVRITGGEPATIATRVLLGERRFEDKAGLLALEREWQARGLGVEVHTLGAVYGIAGKVIDNRSYLLLLQGALTPAEATRKQAELARKYGVRTSLFDELRAPSSGILELIDEAGNVAAVGEDVLDAETPGGEPFDLQKVEFGVGYDFHNFENRSFRGGLRFTVDRQGMLAVVNLVPLEELLKGLVPSEIFSRAHLEALKAQAVTARGEVLAKIGTKHLADPYLLCSEQHCAVYKGLSGEAPSTNAAVEATRGEALFARDGRLVDSVYSAVCGGWTEDNDAVWGGVPNPNLRGRPDFISPTGKEPTPEELSKFLAAELPSACRLSDFAQPTRYRWERRFTSKEVDALTADLHVGRIVALTVTDRGVSGRAKTLLVSGENGATQLRGELNIRRRFKMLNSAMFLVSPERDAQGAISGWLFRGGGWGHGVGMCQTGAAGRAEAGQDYKEILRYYFSGAEVARIY